MLYNTNTLTCSLHFACFSRLLCESEKHLYSPFTVFLHRSLPVHLNHATFSGSSVLPTPAMTLFPTPALTLTSSVLRSYRVGGGGAPAVLQSEAVSASDPQPEPVAVEGACRLHEEVRALCARVRPAHRAPGRLRDYR